MCNRPTRCCSGIDGHVNSLDAAACVLVNTELCRVGTSHLKRGAEDGQHKRYTAAGQSKVAPLPCSDRAPVHCQPPAPLKNAAELETHRRKSKRRRPCKATHYTQKRAPLQSIWQVWCSHSNNLQHADQVLSHCGTGLTIIDHVQMRAACRLYCATLLNRLWTPSVRAQNRWHKGSSI